VMFWRMEWSMSWWIPTHSANNAEWMGHGRFVQREEERCAKACVCPALGQGTEAGVCKI